MSGSDPSSAGQLKVTTDSSGVKALARALTKNATLTSLNLEIVVLCGVNLEGKGVYDASGVYELCEGLSLNKTLTEIDLSGNRMGGRGLSDWVESDGLTVIESKLLQLFVG